MRALAVALVLVACSDAPAPALSSLPDPVRPAEAPAEPVAPTEPPMVTPPTTPPPTTPPPTARAPGISPEVTANVRRLVQEARALEHDGNHAGALARFDEALRLVPSQPRILCEAGFVAHRAGDEALAGRRIDAALAVFGEPRLVSDRLRVPLAMCLYNRGLVAEAEADPRRAADVYAASVALRPSATVDAALARARAAVAALPAHAAVDADLGTVGGVPFVGHHYVLAATDPSTYEGVLRSGLRGCDWDGSYLPATETRVTRHPIDTAGHPSVMVHSVATPDGETRLVVTWPLHEGLQARDLSLGHAEASDGVSDDSVGVSEVTSHWVGDVLRLDVTSVHHTGSRLFYTGDDDLPCQEGSEERVTSGWAVLCRASTDAEGEIYECVSFQTRRESSGVTSYAWCEGSDEGEGETTTGASLARAVVTADASGVTISQVRDDAAVLRVDAGHYAWDDVFLLDTPILLTEWVSDDE